LLQPTKVLIVEDEKLFAQNLRSFLEARGWHVALASSGREAVQAGAAFEPALVLLDYQLADMNGFQALVALRERHPCCGCVLMTAHPACVVTAGAAQHRIRHFLWKPFSLAEMEAQLIRAGSAPAGSATR